MRIFVFLCILFTCTVAKAQGDKAKETPVAAASKQSLVKVFYLKHAKSTAVRQTLSQLGLEAKISEDVRLNALLVQATEEVQKQIADFLSSIDSEDPNEETTQIYYSDLLEKGGGGELVEQFAKTAGVDLAFDKDSGVFIIKGPKVEVERVQKIIGEIGEASTIRSDKSRQNRQSDPFAIRVLWLSNDPAQDSRNPIEPDAALTKSIEKLAELGYANMKVKMQLLGRCDIIQGKASSVVEGSLVSGTTRRSLSAEVKLSSETPAPIHGAFTILAGITTHPNSDAVPEKASVDVAINLEPKKYYILSATPVGGYQTAFVVQLVNGL